LYIKDIFFLKTPYIPPVFEPQILEMVPKPHVSEPQIIEPLQETPLPNIGSNESNVLNKNIENILPLSPIHIETLSPDSPTITSDALIIHPKYQPLTLDEIIILLDLILLILETLTSNSVDIERPTKLIPRYELNKIQIRPLRRPKPSQKPLSLSYKKPYQFFTHSEPNIELLKNVFHDGLKSLIYMEEDALIFPLDITAEPNALKANVCDAIDSICVHLQEKTKGRGMTVLSDLMDIAENVNPPRITDSANLDFDEHAIMDMVSMHIQEYLTSAEEELQKAEQEKTAKELEDKRLVEEQERELVAKEQDVIMNDRQEIDQGSDKGNNPIEDTTPPASPIKTLSEFGTASSRIDPEVREMLHPHQAHIASLTESEQRTQATLSQILSVLSDIQQHSAEPPKPLIVIFEHIYVFLILL
jgi:hypothetical protein